MTMQEAILQNGINEIAGLYRTCDYNGCVNMSYFEYQASTSYLFWNGHFIKWTFIL